MNTPLLLHGVAKNYGRHAVLREINLRLQPGDAVGIVGANGSGKSTLLRIIAGVCRPSSGVVTGKATRAYVPDRFPGRQRMSAHAYLRHMGQIRGMRPTRAKARADDLLERFKLANAPDTPIRELSKGNVQKVMLAQALLVTPRILVLDEPWSGLEPATEEVLTEVMAEVIADEHTVVFSDHRSDYVRMLATRPYRLHEGTLRALQPADISEDDLIKVVLRGGQDTDWTRTPGVVDVHHSDHYVELAVHTAERDSLLLTALQQGWSVLAVENASVTP